MGHASTLPACPADEITHMPAATRPGDNAGESVALDDAPDGLARTRLRRARVMECRFAARRTR